MAQQQPTLMAQPELVQQLSAMGFSEAAARHGLIATGNSIARAVDWITVTTHQLQDAGDDDNAHEEDDHNNPDAVPPATAAADALADPQGSIVDPRYSWMNGYGATALGGLTRMRAALAAAEQAQAERERRQLEVAGHTSARVSDTHSHIGASDNAGATAPVAAATAGAAAAAPLQSTLLPTSLLKMPDLLLLAVLQLLDVRELAALRRVSRDFWRREQPRDWEGRGLVEEAAWLQVASRADRHLAPPRGGAGGEGGGWLRILSELRALAEPLRFTAVHNRLRVTPDGTTLLKSGQGADYHTGYCGRAVMRAGVHRAEMKIIRYNGDVCVGVALAAGVKGAVDCDNAATTGLADDGGSTDVLAGWGIAAHSGKLRHAGQCTIWDGHGLLNHHSGACVTGDTITLELDCDEGTLACKQNGRELGLLTDALPRNVELCWFAELYYGGDAVRVARPAPPPQTLAGAAAAGVAVAAAAAAPRSQEQQ